MRTVLLLLSLTLAGCATLDELRPPASEATVLPWGLTECRFAVAIIPAEAEAVKAHLPPGFEPYSFSEIGLPPDPRGGANVGVELWACDDGVAANGTTGPLAYAATFTFAHAPQGLDVNGSTFTFYKWDVLAQDPALRQALDDAGVPAYEGEGAFSQFQAAPQGAFDGTTTFNGTYALQGILAAPADDALRSFRFTELTQGSDGLVWWNVTAESTTVASGTGRVTLPEGTLRDIVGTPTAQAYFLGGMGSFTNATVTLPPRLADG